MPGMGQMKEQIANIAKLYGVTVLPPDRVHETGATDVVISSWMHQEEIWARWHAHATGAASAVARAEASRLRAMMPRLEALDLLAGGA